jgi:hypothetical protein
MELAGMVQNAENRAQSVRSGALLTFFQMIQNA